MSKASDWYAQYKAGGSSSTGSPIPAKKKKQEDNITSSAQSWYEGYKAKQSGVAPAVNQSTNNNYQVDVNDATASTGLGGRMDEFKTWQNGANQQAPGYSFTSSKDLDKVGNGVAKYVNGFNYTRENHDSYRAQVQSGLTYIDNQMSTLAPQSKAYKQLKKYRAAYSDLIGDLDYTSAVLDTKDYFEDKSWHDADYRASYQKAMEDKIVDLQTQMGALDDKNSDAYKRLKAYYDIYVDYLYADILNRNKQDEYFKDANDYTNWVNAQDYSHTLELQNNIDQAQARIDELLGKGKVNTSVLYRAGTWMKDAKSLLSLAGEAGKSFTGSPVVKLMDMLGVDDALKSSKLTKEEKAELKELENSVAEWKKDLEPLQAYQRQILEYNHPFDIDEDYQALIDENNRLIKEAAKGTDIAQLQTQNAYFQESLDKQKRLREFIPALETQIDDLKDTINYNASHGNGAANPELYAQLEEKQAYINECRLEQTAYNSSKLYEEETGKSADPELAKIGEKDLVNPSKVYSTVKNAAGKVLNTMPGGGLANLPIKENGGTIISLGGKPRMLGNWLSKALGDPDAPTVDENGEVIPTALSEAERNTIYRLYGQAKKSGSEKDIETFIDYCDYVNSRLSYEDGKAKNKEDDSWIANWANGMLTEAQGGLYSGATGLQNFGIKLAAYIDSNSPGGGNGMIADIARNVSGSDAYYSQLMQQAQQSLGERDPHPEGKLANILYGQNFMGTGVSPSQLVGEGVQTVANMAPSIALGQAGGSEQMAKLLSTTLLGGSAANSAYMQAMQQGYGEGQALGYGALMGATEAASEYWVESAFGRAGISEGKLMEHTKNISNAHAKFWAQKGIRILGEVEEEYMQNKVEYLVNDLVLNQYDKFELFNEDDWHTVLSTAFSTGLLEVNGGTRNQTVVADKYGKALTGEKGLVSKRHSEMAKNINEAGKILNEDGNTKQTLIWLADQLDGEKSEAAKAAKELASELDSGKTKATNSNIGRLYQLYAAAVGDSNLASVQLLNGALAYRQIETSKAENQVAQERLSEVRKANPQAAVLDTVQTELKALDGTLNTRDLQLASDAINAAASGYDLTPEQTKLFTGETKASRAARAWLANHGSNISVNATGTHAQTMLDEYITGVRTIKAQQRQLQRVSVVQAAMDASRKAEVSKATQLNKIQPQERVPIQAKENLFKAQNEAASAEQALAEAKSMNINELAAEARAEGADKTMLQTARHAKQLAADIDSLKAQLKELRADKTPSRDTTGKINALQNELDAKKVELVGAMRQLSALDKSKSEAEKAKTEKTKAKRSEQAKAQRKAFEEMTGKKSTVEETEAEAPVEETTVEETSKPVVDNSDIIEAKTEEENPNGRESEEPVSERPERNGRQRRGVRNGRGRSNNESHGQVPEGNAEGKTAEGQGRDTGRDSVSRGRAKTRSFSVYEKSSGLTSRERDALGITKNTKVRTITDFGGSRVLGTVGKIATALGIKTDFLSIGVDETDAQQKEAYKNKKAYGMYLKGAGRLFSSVDARQKGKSVFDQTNKHEVGHGIEDIVYGEQSVYESAKLLLQIYEALELDDTQRGEVVEPYIKKAGAAYATARSDPQYVFSMIFEDILNDLLSQNPRLLKQLPKGAHAKAMEIFRASQLVERALEKTGNKISAEEIYQWFESPNEDLDFDLNIEEDEAEEAAEKAKKVQKPAAQKQTRQKKKIQKAAETAAKQAQVEAAKAEEPFIYGEKGEKLTRDQFIALHSDWKDPGKQFDLILERMNNQAAELANEKTVVLKPKAKPVVPTAPVSEEEAPATLLNLLQSRSRNGQVADEAATSILNDPTLLALFNQYSPEQIEDATSMRGRLTLIRNAEAVTNALTEATTERPTTVEVTAAPIVEAPAAVTPAPIPAKVEAPIEEAPTAVEAPTVVETPAVVEEPAAPTPIPAKVEAPVAEEEDNWSVWDNFYEEDDEWSDRFDAIEDLEDSLRGSKLSGLRKPLRKQLEAFDKRILAEEEISLDERANLYSQIEGIINEAMALADEDVREELEQWIADNGDLFYMESPNTAIYAPIIEDYDNDFDEDQYYEDSYYDALPNDSLSAFSEEYDNMLDSLGYSHSDLAPDQDWSIVLGMNRDEFQYFVETHLTSEGRDKYEAIHNFDTAPRRSELMNYATGLVQNSVPTFDGSLGKVNDSFEKKLDRLVMTNDAYALKYAFEKYGDGYGSLLVRNMAEQSTDMNSLQDISLLIDRLTKDCPEYTQKSVEREIDSVIERLDAEDRTRKANFITLNKLQEEFEAGRKALEKKIPGISALADKVFGVSRNLGLRIFEMPWRRSDAGLKGHSAANLLSLNANEWNGMTPEQKSVTILHELIHACTSYAIDSYSSGELTDPGMRQAVEAINAVQTDVQNDQSLTALYGVRTAKETIAELADPEWRKALEKKEMFGSVVDAVGNFLDSGDTLESATVEALNYLLDNFDQNLFNKYVATERENKRGIIGDGMNPITGEKQYGQHGMSFIAEMMQEKYREATGNPNAIFSVVIEDEDTSPVKFYSKMEKEANDILTKQKKVTPENMLKQLKSRGVKGTELKWSGVEVFLSDYRNQHPEAKWVDADELRQFMGDNKVQVETIVRTDDYKSSFTPGGDPQYIPGGIEYTSNETGEVFTMDQLRALAESEGKTITRIEDFWQMTDEETNGGLMIVPRGFEFGYDPDSYDTSDDWWDAFSAAGGVENYFEYTERAEDKGGGSNSTHWRGFVTPGGVGYREYLYTLPGETYSNSSMKTHWREQTGVFGHARVSDFNDGVRLIEEVQSDWSNAGWKSQQWVSKEQHQETAEKQKSLRDELDTVSDRARKISKQQYDLQRELEINYAIDDLLNNVKGQRFDGSTDSALRIELMGSAPIGDVLDEFAYQFLTLDEETLYDKVSDFVSSYPIDVSTTEAKTVIEQMREKYVAPSNLEAKKEQLNKLEEERQSLLAQISQIENVLTDFENVAVESPFNGKNNEAWMTYTLRDQSMRAAQEGMNYLAWTSAKMQSDRWSDEYAGAYENTYDKKIPSFMTKFGSQFGAKVIQLYIDNAGRTHVITPETIVDVDSNGVEILIDAGTGEILGDYGHAVQALEINDAMRQSLQEEGLAIFSPVIEEDEDPIIPSTNVAENVDETPATVAEMQANTYPDNSIESIVINMLQENEFDLEAVNTALNELYQTRMNELAEQSGMRAPNVIPAKHTAKLKPGEDKAIYNQLDRLIGKFGKMENKGWKSGRDIIMPKNQTADRLTRRMYQSAAAAEGTAEYMVPYIDRDVITNLAASYVRQHNKDAENKAIATIAGDYDRANALWDGIASEAHIPTSSDIALGELLFMQAAKEGQVNRAMKILADVAAMGTAAGQTVQAMSMIKKLTPAGQLYYLQQAVNRLNKKNENLITSGRAKALEIDDDMADKVFNAQSQEELDNAIEDIKNDLAKQIPVTLKDKWDAWRYLAMLGNFRTHGRNIFGNALFMPARFTKDLIACGLEHAFVAKDYRTKDINTMLASSIGTATSFATGKWKSGKQVDVNPYTQFANKDFDVMQSVVAQSGKYNAIDDLMDRRQIFRAKGLEKASRLNTDALEGEDAVFLKRAYVSAMSQYLAARGADVSALMNNDPQSARLLNEARQYATQEAQKATYRDFSAAAAALNKMKKIPGVGTLLEGILPFTKTPINILRRGMDYSPIGLAKGLGQAFFQVRTGKVTAAEAIDTIAAGASGTIIAAIGVLLAHLGAVTGSDDDDDKQAAFDALQGQQKYALKIGNGSYTIDWMAPISLPFFVGVELYNALSNDAGIEMDPTNLYHAMLSVAEPIMSLSMLDGLATVLSADDYVEGDAAKIATLVTTSAGSYFGQVVPTLAGQVGRTIDGTRRSTYIDKNSKVPADLQYFWQASVQSKVPGYMSQRMAYVDEWGRTDPGIKNVGLRALQNIVSPGYWRAASTTPTDEELQRLADATGDNSILPTKAQKYFTVNKARKNLTADEYQSLQTERGQTAYHLITTLIHDSRYNSLSDEEKAKVIGYFYDYSGAVAQYHLDNDYNIHGAGKWIEEAEKMADPFERIWEQAYNYVETKMRK